MQDNWRWLFHFHICKNPEERAKLRDGSLSIGHFGASQVSIVQHDSDTFDRYLRISSGPAPITEHCTLLGGTSVRCAAELYYVSTSQPYAIYTQTLLDVGPPDQVPITGLIVGPGSPTPARSYLSSCYAQQDALVPTTGLSFESSGTPVTTGSTARSSGHSIPTTTSQSQPTNISGQTDGLSTGAKAGIGVGAAIGGILLVALGAFGAIMLMRRSSSRAQDTEDVGDSGDGSKFEGSHSTGVADPTELGSEHRAKELATGKEAHELSGKSRAAELAARTSRREAGRQELE